MEERTARDSGLGPVTARRGRPPRSDQQRADQRAELIVAATDAVRHRGVDISIDEIADWAGVSKPVLYSHFGDKLGLADAIAASLAERITNAAAESYLSAPPQDFREVVAPIVEALILLIEDDPAVYAFLVRTIRAGERGFFDNALVGVIRERATGLVSSVAPAGDGDTLRVLIDGAFGFLFFSVESWQTTRTPRRDVLIRTLVDAIVAGFEGATTS